MAMAERETFSSRADPALLARLREIAAENGRDFDVVVEDAFQVYIKSCAQQKVRPEVMGHFWASVEKNRGLLELLAQ